MTIFTRVPFSYWADRAGMPIIFSGVGLFFTILIFVKGRDELAAPESILSLLFSVALIIGGIVFYFRYHLPTRIEIDESEIRVFYTPKKIIVIPRKDVIIATGYCKGMHGGTGKAIYYKKDEKLGYADIQALYRNQKGITLKRGDINTAINKLLKIKEAEARVQLAKLL